MKRIEALELQISEAVREFLTARFFYYVGTCRCGGVLNIKYKNGNYCIYVRPVKQFFLVKFGNNTIVPLTRLNELEKIFQTTPKLQEQVTR